MDRQSDSRRKGLLRGLFGRGRTEEPLEDQPSPEELAREAAAAVDRAMRFSRPPVGFDAEEHREFADKAIGAIQAASIGIEDIQSLLGDAGDIVESARTADRSEKADLAERYEATRDYIDMAASRACFQGINLIDGGQSALTLNIGMDRHVGITISHMNLTAGRKGMNLPPLRHKLFEDVEIDDAASAVMRALRHVEWAGNVFRQEASLLAQRFAQDLKEQISR